MTANELEYFFRKYYKRLVGYAVGIIQDKVIAQDIVADSFISCRNLPNDECYIRNALFLSVKNKCFSHLSKQKIRKKFARFSLYISDDFIDGEKIAQDKIYREEMMKLISNVISEMPIGRKKVILRYLQGKDTATIANELSIKSQSVLNQKTRAIEELRKAIIAENHKLFFVNELT